MPATTGTAQAAPAASAAASSTNVLNRRAPSTSANPFPAYAAPAAPAAVIAVDAAAPPGKNWEYTHYFPESGVKVPQGGVVLFKWDQGSLNGLHSVTFVPITGTEAAGRIARPVITSDTDHGEHDVITPAVTNNGSSATCGNSPTAPPCLYDGTAAVSSGIIPNSVGAAFPVQIGASLPPGTYHYFCVIHPGMSGSIDVVQSGTAGSTPAAVAAAAASELSGLNATAAAAEAAQWAAPPASTTNADGSKTWNVHAGLTADDVELLQYFPPSLPIKKGDSVKFDAALTTQEVHTATFPIGGPGFAIPPFLPNQCESATGADTAAAQAQGPPQLGCADPNGLEQPYNLGPQGSLTQVTNGISDAASTGVITSRADFLAVGAPASHTYQFPNEGTYYFFCHFHQNMFGAVSTPGYRLAAADAGLFAFGGLGFHGSQGGQGVASPVVAAPAMPDNQGYWLVTADGHTANFGTAPPVGSVSGKLASPIVGAVATPDGQGLYLAGKDGGVFTLGSAVFMGGLGGIKLAQPIVGITTDLGGTGYDLAAADGGVFNFGVNSNGGGSRFFGGLGGIKLNKPIVGIIDTPDGQGYDMVATDGGVFAFGPSAGFFGGLGGIKLNSPIVGISLTADFQGYRLAAGDGGVFDFGDAGFFGGLGGIKLNSPIIGITGT
jgi:plastocyanin